MFTGWTTILHQNELGLYVAEDHAYLDTNVSCQNCFSTFPIANFAQCLLLQVDPINMLDERITLTTTIIAYFTFKLLNVLVFSFNVIF